MVQHGYLSAVILTLPRPRAAVRATVLRSVFSDAASRKVITARAWSRLLHLATRGPAGCTMHTHRIKMTTTKLLIIQNNESRDGGTVLVFMMMMNIDCSSNSNSGGHDEGTSMYDVLCMMLLPSSCFGHAVH